jgi:archaellum component FlaF (FlaF/FlaG flagellin family)
VAPTYNSQVIGNALFANLTNDGSTSIDVDDMWVSVDGDLPVYLTSIESSTTFGTFFPSESISIIFLEGGLVSTVTSLSVTANGAVASFGV